MPVRPPDPARLAAALLLLWTLPLLGARDDWRCVAEDDGRWSCAGAEARSQPGSASGPTVRPILGPAALETAAHHPGRGVEVRSAVAFPGDRVRVLRQASETVAGTPTSADAAAGAARPADEQAAGLPTKTETAAAAKESESPATGRASAAPAGADAEAAADAAGNRGAAVDGGTGAQSGSQSGAQSAGTPRATSVPSRDADVEPGTAAPPAGRQAGTAAGPGRDTDLLYEGLTWEFCGQRPPGFGPATLPPPPGEEDRVFIGADVFDYDRDLDLLWLEGDVRLTQGSRALAADKVVYDRDSADLLARGNVFLANPGIRILADQAEINLETDKGSLDGVQYRLTETANARGTADRAELIDPTLTRYHDIRYTTCRPGQDVWSLDASRLDLDQAKGRGVARHAKLLVRGVPVFYTPYASFPIDDRRKSGFLIPTFGNSDENGVDLTVPYYWNIAPNMDATFFPRHLSKRGTMLGTEFRFLSRGQEAEIYGEVLPGDSQRDDNRTRWGLRIDQKGRLGRRLNTNLSIDAVSDDEYLEDFGNQLELTSTRNIERRGDLTYRADRWQLRMRLQDFQTLDETIPPRGRPYKRLPQLAFSMPPYRLDPGIQLGLGAEFDAFRHDEKTEGERLALQPYARWPLRKSYGHLIPQVNLYVADYALDDPALEADDHPSYAIPSFNLDGGLVFERSVGWLNQDALQTLEPRLFYLYTPFEDQQDIPVFDSNELTFSYFSLFRPNRFSGKDRIGDANQLTLGLTSRTLARRSGRELLRASVGQILYFQDREVQLRGAPEEADSSAVAGILSARLLSDVTGYASFEYDPNEDTDRSRKRTFELHYRDREDRLLNLAYRFDIGRTEATRYEDTDVSFRLPVSEALEFVGRWNYSLLNSQTVEAFAGVEYGQCCWRMRLLGRHLKNRPDSTGSNTFLVQVELAGLASIGQSVDRFLERGIYGYQSD